MTVTNRFAINSTGNEWSGKLLDCTDPENPKPVDLTGFEKVYIVFTKPDGTQFPTDQQMIDEIDQGAVLETPLTPTDSNIVFSNVEVPSILDLIGYWEYVPAVKIDNTLIKSPVKTSFWVS